MRRQALHQWLTPFYPVPFEAIRPASSDASFRRYYRVMTPEGSRILMDAPPDKEDCHSFVRISRLFAEAGVHVPRIFAWEEKLGFMMLEDFGETSYLSALQTDGGQGLSADTLYGNALEALVRIQLASGDGVLPLYERPCCCGKSISFQSGMCKSIWGSSGRRRNELPLRRWFRDCWMPSKVRHRFGCIGTTIVAT
ncbi:MAG: phosphotransferase [Ferrovum myxofaciens]